MKVQELLDILNNMPVDSDILILEPDGDEYLDYTITSAEKYEIEGEECLAIIIDTSQIEFI